MSFAPALALREGDRKKLGDLARLPSVASGLAKRARMILLAADGVPNAEIARVTGVSRPPGGSATRPAGSPRWRTRAGRAARRGSTRSRSSPRPW